MTEQKLNCDHSISSRYIDAGSLPRQSELEAMVRSISPVSIRNSIARATVILSSESTQLIRSTTATLARSAAILLTSRLSTMDMRTVISSAPLPRYTRSLKLPVKSFAECPSERPKPVGNESLNGPLSEFNFPQRIQSDLDMMMEQFCRYLPDQDLRGMTVVVPTWLLEQARELDLDRIRFVPSRPLP
jgi:hypothetical protein